MQMSENLKKTFEEKFNKQRNYNSLMAKIKEERKMNKLGYFLVPVTALAVVGMIVGINLNSPKVADEILANNENISTQISVAQNTVSINNIEDLIMTKLLVDSKELTKEDLEDDLSFMKDFNIADNKLDTIFAYYTKGDTSKEEFNVLHDYVFMYSNQENTKNVKVSLSKVGKPLRDYFFNTTSDISKVAGTDVVISKYEDKYIANFEKDGINIDVETKGFTQTEMVKVIEDIILK